MPDLKSEIKIEDLLAKNKQYVVMFVVVVLSLVLAKNLYQKQIKQYDRLKEEIRVEQEKSSALERIVGVDTKLKDLKKHGWDSSDFNTISSRIGKMASESGVRVQNMDPSDKMNEDNFIIVPFTIRAEGALKDLIRFFKRIETYTLATRIKHLELTRKVTGTVGGQEDKTLNAVIQIQAYYFK